jgi:hypothetical protein
MAGRGRFAAVLAGSLLAVGVSSSTEAAGLKITPVTNRDLVEIQWPGPGYSQDWQGRREHCFRMRERLRGIRYRMESAPPWERDRLRGRMYELRERLRQECWGHWRGD